MRQAAIVLLLLVAPAHAAATPPALPWWETSALDADGDRIDDALDADAAGPLRILLTLPSPATPRDLRAIEAAGATVAWAGARLPVVAATAARADLGALAALPRVLFVEKEDTLELALRESAPMVQAPQARDETGATGAGVVVAVLDDGIDRAHPDLAGRVVASFDAAPAPAPLPVPLPDPLGILQETRLIPTSTAGHGTHVAGIVAGSGAASDGALVGVAPGAALVDVDVFSGPNSTTSTLALRGLEWTMENAARLGVRIVVMSLGGRSSDGTDALSRAVDQAAAQGLLVVAAAGNRGPEPGSVRAPGAAAGALTVGAVDKQGALAGFSARGPTPDGRMKPELVAPGVGIVSAVPVASTTALAALAAGGDPRYGAMSGTSMAAPHVAGVAALLFEIEPALTPEQARTILLASAADAGEPGVDPATGHGLVDALSAARLARDPVALAGVQGSAALGATVDDGRARVLLGALGSVGLLVAVGAGGALLLARKAK